MDEDRRPGRFLLTGSANLMIMRYYQKLKSQTVPLLNDARLLGSFSFWVKVDWEINIVGGWRPWGNLIEFNESSFLFRRSLIESLGEWDNVRVAGDREFIGRLSRYDSQPRRRSHVAYNTWLSFMTDLLFQ